MSYEYSGKITCLNCKGKYRGKMQRSKRVYVCKIYDTEGGSLCSRRFAIEEDKIKEVIKRHHKLMNVREEVSKIEVDPVNKKLYFYYANGKKYQVEQNSIGEYISSV